MKKRQLIIQVFLIGLVFALFAFFRFYNLDKRIIFDWDQEQFSNQIKNIIVNHKLTLLGPRVVSDTGFFLAPYFTYFLIPFYLLTSLHPWALIYFLIFFNILFFFLSFFILKKMFNFYSAVIFLLLWSFNFLFVQYDIIPWWPVTIPLGVILTWFALYRIYKFNLIKDWFILGIILGLFMNMHFQFVFLIFFSGLFLVFLFFLEKKVKFSIKKLLVLKFTFLAFFTPLLLFDLRHNFLNINLFFNFFFTNQVNLKHDYSVWLIVFTNFIEPFIFLRSTLTAKLFYLVLLLIFFYLFKVKKSFYRIFYLSSLILWLFFPICFALYGKRPSEYYFMFLSPFILITLIDFIFLAKKNYLLILFTAFFFLININKVKTSLKSNFLGLYYKDKIITIIKKGLGNRNSDINRDLGIGRDTGFGYLIDFYDLDKRKGKVTDQVQIRFPPQKNDLIIGEYGINYSWQNK